MLNLDTHILLYALNGDLSRNEKEILSNDEWGISSIVIWEISKLCQLDRIEFDIHDPEFKRILAGINIWPINLDICRKIHELDFQSDPADEIIAATSIIFDAPLVTRDRLLIKSKLIPLAKISK